MIVFSLWRIRIQRVKVKGLITHEQLQFIGYLLVTTGQNEVLSCGACFLGFVGIHCQYLPPIICDTQNSQWYWCFSQFDLGRSIELKQLLLAYLRNFGNNEEKKISEW